MLAVSAVARLAFVVMAASAAATIASAATAVTAHLAHESLHLLLGGLTVLNHLAHEIERFACQRRVEVDADLVGSDVEHDAHEEVSVLVLQRNACAFEHHFVVKFAVYLENALVKAYHTLLVVVAESKFLGQFKVEVGTLFQHLDSHFKAVESHAEAGDELEGTVV